MSGVTPVDNYGRHPQAVVPGPGTDAWSPQAPVPAEPFTNRPTTNTQSGMSPTETCARNPNIYRTGHWVFDTASGYCAWCGERIA
jgi:hypothetical protein